MKKTLKHFMLMLCFVMTVLFSQTITFATTTENDNLKVRFEVIKVDDTTNEIYGKVKVTNIGVRPIEGISIENILPDGVKLKEGSSLTKEIGTLEAGSSSTFEFYGELESILPPINNGGENKPSNDNATGEDKPSVDNNSDINKPSIEVSEGVNNSQEGSSYINTDSVNTGDNNIIPVLIVTIAICSGIILLSKKKNINGKKLLSIFICCIFTATLINSAAIVQVDENNKKQISVKENIVVNDNTYTIETIVRYSVKSNVVIPSGSVVTRGEWIAKLVDCLDLKEKQEIEIEIEDFEYPYSDVEGTEYEEDILYALVYSILDGEEDTFNVNEPATREFASVTAVKALNFKPVQDIVCDDSNEIQNLKEIEVAVSMDIITLENNKFYPLRALTQSEAEYIIQGVEGIIKSSEVDLDYDSSIEYKDDVIQVDDEILYEVNGTIVTFELNEVTKKLKENDIFILPNERPYKVLNVKQEDDKLIVETVDPKIEEVLEYIDAQGNATVDISGFIPAEGVEVIEGNSPEARGINIDHEGSIGGGESINLSISKEVDYFEITGDISFNLPSIKYKADIDVGFFDVDINNVYLKFPMSVDLNGSISISSEPEENVEITDEFFELGSIPVAGIPGIMIYVEVGLTYSMEGQIGIVFTCEGELGAQVLNNRFRAIKDIDTEFEMPKIEASAKIGTEVGGLLKIYSLWDVIDFSAGFGGAVEASAIIRQNGMTCIEAGSYIYGEFSALERSIIKDWLEISYNWEFWNSETSPFKVILHIENLHFVPECTYGNGTFIGTVTEAGNREGFIEGALIQVYNASNNKLVKSALSDSRGIYSIKVNSGEYIIKISKDGYITFESIEIISADEEKYLETYLMVEQGYEGEEGIAGGKITNAVTGGKVPGILINVYKGWKQISGNIIATTTTDENGIYQVTLPLGNYTIEMEKEGYLTKYYNIFVISGSSLDQNNTPVPHSSEMPSGDLRMVLTWREKPYDLDSHLVGHKANGQSNFHIYYASKTYFKNNIKYADLDLDDMFSYGPETTTVYNINSSGVYNYYVHDFSNRNNSSSTAMSNSGAKVEVYKGDSLYATYSIPTNTPGTYWHVFDYDAATNKIIPVNNFVEGIVYRCDELNRYFVPLWEVEEKIVS